MRRFPRRTILGFALAFGLGLAASVVGAETPDPPSLDLPLYDPARGLTRLPGYAAHKLELQLRASERSAPDRLRPAAGRLGIASLDAVLSRLGVERLEREFPGAAAPAPGEPGVDLTGYYVVHLPEETSLAEALRALAADPAVESAEPIGVFPVAVTPNDSLFGDQYNLDQANDRDGDFPEAWDRSEGDTSVVVAIVDTGVLWTHPDLGGPAPHTGGTIWHNWIEMGGLPGVDDDLNGFVDDFRGWDFVTGVSGAPGEDLSVRDNDPSDFVGHGTFVAGIAGAIHDNGSGIAGGGRNLKIMALRAGWDDGVSSGGVVDMSFCAQAIRYATEMGAVAINCSWSNGDLSGLGAAVDDAIGRGVSIVVAAGNRANEQQNFNYLSTRGDCVDVAALDADDARAVFSSFGSWVDVSVGGLALASTYSFDYQPGYTSGSGTSFSAPLVTAAIGLYQSWRRSQGLPPADAEEVLLRIRDTSDPVDDLNPLVAGKLGGGRLNALRLMIDPPTSFVVRSGGALRTSPAHVAWNGSEGAIVFGTTASTAVAVGAAIGDTLSGWPVVVAGPVESDPAVFDLDRDGVDEVLLGTDGGLLHVLEEDGSATPGWPKTLAGTIRSGPAVGDVAGGFEFEVVVATTAPNAIHVLDRFGTEMPGWPRSMPEAMTGGPALFDLDGDGKAEIVIGGNDSTVHVFHGDGAPAVGWPARPGAEVRTLPAIGDLDGDGSVDVVAGAIDGTLHAWSANGVALAGWPLSLGEAIASSPALVDLNGDDRLEVIVGTEGSRIHVFEASGIALPGWPVLLDGPIRGEVVVAEVDGDGALEVIAATLSGTAHVRNADGTAVLHWPRSTGGSVLGSPSVGDPDGDGRVEITVGSESQRLYTWDLGPATFDAGRRPWFTAGRSFLRQAAVDLPAVGPPPPGPGAFRLDLIPNPALSESRALLQSGSSAAGEVEFSLHDLSGRIVRRARRPFDATGVAVWRLDAEEAGGVRLAAGVYWVRARFDELTLARKWVVLR